MDGAALQSAYAVAEVRLSTRRPWQGLAGDTIAIAV